jgi:competence protein ComEC
MVLAFDADQDSSDAATAAAPPPIDLRLALGTSVSWLATLLGLAMSPRSVAVTGLAGLAIGALCLLCARRGVRWAACAGVAASFAAIVLIPLAARLASVRASPVWALAQQRLDVTVEALVTDDPRPLAAKGVAGSPRVIVDAAVQHVLFGGGRVDDRGSVVILAPASDWRDVGPGQLVRLSATLQPPLGHGFQVASVMARSPPIRIGSPPWWQHAASDMRAALRHAVAKLPAGPRGLLPGLVVGDTSGLDPVLSEHFRTAGLTHLVAVSGTNCVILVGAVLLVLRRLRVHPAGCAVCGGIVLVAFVVVARPSPSVLRAAVMSAIALAAMASGRQRHAVPALSVTVLGLLLWKPALAPDAGFTMSALATASLLLVAPGWADALRRRHVPGPVADWVAVAAAAHVATAPVIVAISGRVSIVAIPANLLAEPVVAVTTVLGFAAAVAAPLWMSLGEVLAAAAALPCRWLIWVADFFGRLPGATLPWRGDVIGGFLLLGVLAVLWLLAAHRRTRRLVMTAVAVAVIVQIPVRTVVNGWPPSGWIFTACDIGQGDALVLPAGAHQGVVVDTGPDPVVIDRCLHDLSITDIPILVLTHYHLDHVGGIVGALRARHVGRVLVGPLDEPTVGLDLVRAALLPRGLTTTIPLPGATFVVGAVRLDVLAPAKAFHGTHSDPNNSALVIRATVGDERILLAADAEVEAQQALLASGVDLRADVLKVPHHGSAYFDANFLRAVHARIGVISVGLHNDYGHPSPLLLAALSRIAVPVFRTDRDGDVAVVARQHALTAVQRGLRSSTIGAGHLGDPRPGRVTMAQCPTLDPAALSRTASRPLSCSSATRSSSSPARSARSPPRSSSHSQVST